MRDGSRLLPWFQNGFQVSGSRLLVILGFQEIVQYLSSTLTFPYLVEIFEVNFYKQQAKACQLKRSKYCCHYLGFSVVTNNVFQKNQIWEPFFSISFVLDDEGSTKKICHSVILFFHPCFLPQYHIHTRLFQGK